MKRAAVDAYLSHMDLNPFINENMRAVCKGAADEWCENFLALESRVEALEAKQGEGKEFAESPAVSSATAAPHVADTKVSPRPFRVGDRVRWAGGPDMGTIVKTSEGRGCVKWDACSPENWYDPDDPNVSLVASAPPQAPAFIRDLSAELTQALAERDEARRERDELRARLTRLQDIIGGAS